MNGAKHSPGPWGVLGRSIISTAHRPIVADVCVTAAHGPGEVAANTALIAAAPTMLAALVLAERELYNNLETLAVAWNEVRAAIAAARGLS